MRTYKKDLKVMIVTSSSAAYLFVLCYFILNSTAILHVIFLNIYITFNQENLENKKAIEAFHTL